MPPEMPYSVSLAEWQAMAQKAREEAERVLEEARRNGGKLTLSDGTIWTPTYLRQGNGALVWTNDIGVRSEQPCYADGRELSKYDTFRVGIIEIDALQAYIEKAREELRDRP
jgi:hypothetical protein